MCLEISLALSLCHCERRQSRSRCILRWPRLLEPMGICIHTWRRPMMRRERARLPRHQATESRSGDLSPEGSGIGSAGQEGCSLINDGGGSWQSTAGLRTAEISGSMSTKQEKFNSENSSKPTEQKVNSSKVNSSKCKFHHI